MVRFSNRICFYHSADLDGHCSGAIINQHFKFDVNMYGIDYGDRFPWEEVDGETEVWMVDFSLQPEDMIKLNNIVRGFIWIDHHKTAIDAMLDKGEFIRGLREIGKAGCELTWEYLHDFDKDMPKCVYLLGRYDVWDLSDEVLAFQDGMRLFPSTEPDYEQALWARLMCNYNGEIDKVLKDGRLIQRSNRIQNAKLMSATAFRTRVAGLDIIAANVPMSNSQRFESVWNEKEYDAMCPFYRKKNGTWKVSLFSDKDGIDVSRLAKDYGGGGHAGASGFICTELPEWLE